MINSGSNGKFLSVLDFQFRKGKVSNYQYRLLPVFSQQLKADVEMDAYIASVRKPYLSKLNEVLTTTRDTLYRRGNFNGSFDQVILNAMRQEMDAEIALSPGFRWGTSLLPGDAIRMEDLMAQTAISYPQVTLNPLRGEQIKNILEDVADNLFNPDPYYQQGGDMVRTGGLHYSINPSAPIGKRISDMQLAGKAIEANRQYKVAGWASMGEPTGQPPIWDIVARNLRDRKSVV